MDWEMKLEDTDILVRPIKNLSAIAWKGCEIKEGGPVSCVATVVHVFGENFWGVVSILVAYSVDLEKALEKLPARFTRENAETFSNTFPPRKGIAIYLDEHRTRSCIRNAVFVRHFTHNDTRVIELTLCRLETVPGYHGYRLEMLPLTDHNTLDWLTEVSSVLVSAIYATRRTPDAKRLPHMTIYPNEELVTTSLDPT